MSGDDIDSQLDQLIDSCVASKKAGEDHAAKERAEDKRYYGAWNEHMTTVVEPALREFAVKLQANGLPAQVRRIQAPRRLGGSIPDTNGVEFFAGQGAVLNVTPSERSGGSEPTVQVVYRGHHEILGMTKVTREYVRQIALAFLKETIGPDARLGR